jgi:hypothetical protein
MVKGQLHVPDTLLLGKETPVPTEKDAGLAP